MPASSNQLTVTLALLGAGRVVPGGQPETLLPLEPRIMGPAAVDGHNLRFIDGLVTQRPGYDELGTAPNTSRVVGLYIAHFDNGASYTIRCTPTTIHTFDGTNYVDITPAAAPTGGVDDYYTFAMVPRVGTVTPKNWLFISNGVDGIWRWEPGMAQAVLVGGGSPTGTKVLMSYGGRAYALNTDLAGTPGERHHARIYRSIVGDATNWTGLGSGYVDLDADPFPIVAAIPLDGQFIVMKGGVTGGSAWRAIPTGLLEEPDAYTPLNPGSNVGPLMRRTVIQLSDTSVFFVGHDGFYVSNFRDVRRLATTEIRALLARINQDALDGGLAWYKPRANEIHVAIPLAGSKVPAEVWVYNVAEDRLFGPYVYAHNITAASSGFVKGGALTWTLFTYPGGWLTIPFTTWTSISGERAAATVALGTSGGLLLNDRDEMVADNTQTIFSTYETATVRADGRAVPYGAAGASGTVADTLTLRGVLLDYPARLAWTPTVQVSHDGGVSWTVVSDGVPLESGNGALAMRAYATDLHGKAFRVRIGGAAGFALHALHLEFTYGGDARYG